MPRRRREEPPLNSIASRLEHLIATVRPGGRGPLDSVQISALTEKTGTALTNSYISQLRRGAKTNPTIDSLRSLAAVFGVPVSYFFPAEAEPDDESMAPGAPSDERSRHEAAPPLDLSVATKLRELFETSVNADGSRFTVDQVSQRCGELGYDVSALYVQDLLDGIRDNPSVKALEGIARAFDEHVSFFFSAGPNTAASQDEAHADRALRNAMKAEGMEEIVMRSARVDPTGRRLVAAMLREMSDVKITRHEPTAPPGHASE